MRTTIAKAADNLVSTQSVLISGAAGVVTMVIADSLWVTYRLPPRWIALAISFVLGSVALVAIRQTLAQRILCYLCSSSIIFLVAIGSNRTGMVLASLIEPAGSPTGTLHLKGDIAGDKQVLQHLDMGARTRSGGGSRGRPGVLGRTATDDAVTDTAAGPVPVLAMPEPLQPARAVTAPVQSPGTAQVTRVLRSTGPAGKPHFFTRW